jgi:ketosteroid isomerase-like protein
MPRNRAVRSLILSATALMLGCAQAAPSDAGADVGIDSLNARLSQAYRDHDPVAYGRLFTDSALFEWPAFDSPRGPAELEAMARSNWSALRDMDLRLTVSSRSIAPDHATEFGAFEQSWSDSTGARMAEYGRYASLFLRQPDGSWKMHRFLGFEDSTRALSPIP